MNVEKATERLREVNNGLTLLMKERRALQEYIKEENNRLKGIPSPEQYAKELKNDPEFIKLHGRERTSQEIAIKMNYSLRQVQRFLKKQ